MKYLFLRFFSLSLSINFVYAVQDNEIINAISSENPSMLNDNSTESTPLHVAVEHGNWCAVYLLLKNQADANVRNHKRETPLHVAARKGNFEIANLLTDASASLNEQDQDGNTALHLAIAFNNTGLASHLISCNADVTIPNTNYLTPLHQAAEGIESSLVSTLLTHAACVHGRDNFGRTPLHLCAITLSDTQPYTANIFESRKKIARLLVQHGASLDVTDHEGNSPYQLLQQTQRPEIISFLNELKRITIVPQKDPQSLQLHDQ